MAKKSSPQPPPPTRNWAWYWVRTALITILMFVFVLWFALPRNGDVAYLWAAGFSLAILAYFVISYYFLKR